MKRLDLVRHLEKHGCEMLREGANHSVRELAGHQVELTASIGVTDYRTGEQPADLLARADAALYRAKHEGRNRVVADFASRAQLCDRAFTGA